MAEATPSLNPPSSLPAWQDLVPLVAPLSSCHRQDSLCPATEDSLHALLFSTVVSVASSHLALLFAASGLTMWLLSRSEIPISHPSYTLVTSSDNEIPT